MTIAACYLAGDGLVIGADSTTTMYVSGLGPGATGSEHHYDFACLSLSYSGGFCVGGYLPNNRTPSAFEVIYDPTQSSASQPNQLSIGTTRFWGCPSLIDRLIYGVDQGVLAAILQSGKWSGT